MDAFRSAAETWLACNDDVIKAAWLPQKIASALQRDLSDLALDPVRGPVLPWDARPDESFTMGVHYVLEGSALGARVLCAQVAPLGLHSEYGARHLWAQAEHPQNFRGFIDLLNNRASALNESRLIAGANAAFNAAAEALECAANA